MIRGPRGYLLIKWLAFSASTEEDSGIASCSCWPLASKTRGNRWWRWWGLLPDACGLTADRGGGRGEEKAIGKETVESRVVSEKDLKHPRTL